MPAQRATVVQCLRCGHVATLDRVADEMPLVRLTKRLVCSKCGARTMKAERIADVEKSDKPKRRS